MDKERKSGLSAKEAAGDVPSWAEGERPLTTENGRDFARRLLDDKYGAGNYPTGPGSEFSKLRKWGDRAFEWRAGGRPMASVFVLQHVHELGDGSEDIKLIGVYSSREHAEAAAGRLGRLPGFSEAPDGFHIDEYRVDQDHWVEGFVTVTSA